MIICAELKKVFPSIGPRLTNPVNALSYIHKKRGASLMLVPRYKGSRIALPIETSNAESPTPMNIYITLHGIEDCTNSQCGLYINIPRGVPVALSLTNSLNLRDSSTVKTKAFSYAFYIYVSCPLPPLGGFQQWQRLCKDKQLILFMIC